jgi:glycosyltransferase involved in cell wall biosynthesis
MENNVITFIIPSINRESLSKCIDSLINQTNPNWKCIIIYDGVDGKIFNDHRIKTIRIDKIGSKSYTHGMSGLVRNEGLKLCKTEWVGFLDDDDTLHPEYVNKLFSKYSEFDFIIWRMIFPDGLIIPRNNILSFGNVGISIAYKNKFNDLFFDCNRDGEDFDFVNKLLLLSNKYTITEETYYNVNH